VNFVIYCDVAEVKKGFFFLDGALKVLADWKSVKKYFCKQYAANISIILPVCVCAGREDSSLFSELI
jgi:hypothetical protein